VQFGVELHSHWLRHKCMHKSATKQQQAKLTAATALLPIARQQEVSSSQQQLLAQCARGGVVERERGTALQTTASVVKK
jgi:hypothetical protein